jgi:hypothetical protein
MDKSRLSAVMCSCVVCLGITSVARAATLVLIDEFTITKNGTTVFQDTFDNGVPPPDTGGNTQSYNVIGGPLGPESGGKLTLDAASGEIVERPDTGSEARQGARVNTNINPSQPTQGLRTDDLFSVDGVFDLTLPSKLRERYGVRLTDGGSTQPDDSVGLSVMRTSASVIELVFHRYNSSAYTFTDLESFALETSHDQVLLSLSRLDLGNNDITASFSYIDNGIQGTATTFSTKAAIFHGEDFTRAQFIYSTPVFANDIVIDFGDIGLWARMNDASWLKLNNSSPDQVVVGDMDGNGADDVIAYFSSFGGIFVKRNLGGWSQFSTLTPEAMAVGDLDGNGQDDVVIDFGGIGLWARMNDASWLKLNNSSPDQLVVGDMDGNGADDVIAYFSSFDGIFVKRNLGGWSQFSTLIPEAMAVGDLDKNGKDDVVIDFGGIGLWARMNNASWLKLHNSSPDLIATGDLDGNGADDVLATFAGLGLWQKLNLGGWSALSNSAPDAVVTGDVNDSGKDDIIADFGSTLGGIFVKRDQGAWVKLHNTSPEALAVGHLDGI